MQKYFFDVYRDHELIPDEVGSEFADLPTAAREAVLVLGELTREELATATSLELAILVRDQSGRQLLNAKVRFDMEFNSLR
jgi:hypothetical protein